MSGGVGRQHRGRLALATIGVSLALSLGVAELMLRALRPQAVGVSRLPTIYDPDPRLGYRYRAGATGRIQRLFELDNRVIINSQGFHDAEWGDLGGGRPILAVGDSFTAALHLPVELTWTRIVQARLGELLPEPPRVLNLGLDGSGSEVQLALLEENLDRLEPQLVLVAFFENDVADVRRGPVSRETRGRYVIQPRGPEQARSMRRLADELTGRRMLRSLFEHLYAVRLGVYLWHGDRNLLRTNVISPFHLGDRGEHPGKTKTRGKGGLREVFLAFARLAEAWNFQLLVVPVPSREEPGRSLSTYRGEAGAVGIETLDVQASLLRSLRRDTRNFADLYWRWDAHLNEYGNAVFAEAVAEALAERLGARSPSAAYSGASSYRRMTKRR